jgi:hypothetical protein
MAPWSRLVLVEHGAIWHAKRTGVLAFQATITTDHSSRIPEPISHFKLVSRQIFGAEDMAFIWFS